MKTIVEGVCCAYCKFETTECPIITANNWSRWKNFCNEYEPDRGVIESKIFEMKGVEK